jgi:hypothetical protein
MLFQTKTPLPLPARHTFSSAKPNAPGFSTPKLFPGSSTSKSNKLASLTPIARNIRIIKIIESRPGITFPPIRAAVPGNRPIVAERKGELTVTAGLDGEIELELVVALGDVRVSPVLIKERAV